MYKMVKEAIATAENCMKNYEAVVNNVVEIANSDILGAICDYIYDKMVDSGFVEFTADTMKCMRDRHGNINVGHGEIIISVDQYKRGKLWVHSSDDYMRINFGTKGWCVEYNSTTNLPMECLIANWQQIKEHMNNAINYSFALKLQDIKKKNEQIKAREELINNFVL